jgi:hypothetical protein
MSMSSWGIMYFAPGEIIEGRSVFSVYAYPIGTYTLPKPSQDSPIPTLFILAAGGGIATIVMLVGVLRWRRGRNSI